MRALAASLAASIPLSLWGCGGGSDDTTGAPTPAPAPAYSATTVQLAWNNHLDAFVTMDTTKIMLDYDEESMIAVYNDHCTITSASMANPRGYKTYKGTDAIKGFFTELFTQLDQNISNVVALGPKAFDTPDAGASIMEKTGDEVANANVFLTWRTQNLDKPIDYATDSFSWKTVGDNFVINLQTIVTTEPQGACEETTASEPPAPDNPLKQGWDNHFACFGARNATTECMMADYTETSIVQLWDNTKNELKTYTGIDPIQDMFKALFMAMADERTDADDKDTEGLQVGLLELNAKYSSVFLVWESTSHPKATDTFTFVGDKIARQNIVVSSKRASGVAREVSTAAERAVLV